MNYLNVSLFPNSFVSIYNKVHVYRFIEVRYKKEVKKKKFIVSNFL